MSAPAVPLTVLCTAFGPQGGLARLAASLRAIDPAARLIAAGPAAEACPEVDVVKTAAGISPGAARNAMLARVRTPHFALVGDELELHRGAALADLLAPVLAGRLDLAAGELVRCRKKLLVLTNREPAPGHGTFQLDKGSLALHAGVRTAGEGYQVCDYAHHFFAARTDKVRAMGGWDPQLVVGNELEFFVRAQRFNVRIGVCPHVAA